MCVRVWEGVPRSCVESTERSSSPCMRPNVRCRASVTSLVVFITASSLGPDEAWQNNSVNARTSLSHLASASLVPRMSAGAPPGETSAVRRSRVSTPEQQHACPCGACRINLSVAPRVTRACKRRTWSTSLGSHPRPASAPSARAPCAGPPLQRQGSAQIGLALLL